jgi:hypothetical protein
LEIVQEILENSSVIFLFLSSCKVNYFQLACCG